MNRLDVLQQIDEVQRKIESLSGEQKAATELELLELGKQLANPRRKRKIDKLMSKGDKLSYSEIVWLNEQGITKKQLAKTIGMSLNGFYEYLDNHEEVNEMAQGNLEEAKRLLKETDLKVSDICKKTGANYKSVYNYSSKIRSKSKSEKGNITKTYTPKIKVNNDYDDLKKKYAELAEKQVDTNQKLIDKEFMQQEKDKEIKCLEDLVINLQQRKPDQDVESEINKIKEVATGWKLKYEQEKVAHELLFKYLSLVQGSDN